MAQLVRTPNWYSEDAGQTVAGSHVCFFFSIFSQDQTLQEVCVLAHPGRVSRRPGHSGMLLLWFCMLEATPGRCGPGRCGPGGCGQGHGIQSI